MSSFRLGIVGRFFAILKSICWSDVFNLSSFEVLIKVVGHFLLALFDGPTVLFGDVLERLLQTCDRKEDSGARQNSEFGQIRHVENEISIQILFENDLREFVDEILEGDVHLTVSEAG